MRVAIGSDERSALTDAVRDALRERGHELVLFGAIEGPAQPWPQVGREVARAVAEGTAETGVVLCWTGTGVSIAHPRDAPTTAASRGEEREKQAKAVFGCRDRVQACPRPERPFVGEVVGFTGSVVWYAR